ncbi:DinB family protein [Aquirufa antheringensis]|uniref:DinB family protein n=2 Tax=Aquirufa antheringensis TaxID=2516559 RepID=UPI00208F0C9C|nr:DinB family protein [Aquirufa antheringensis]USQ03575.1 DinB family protein [Aquirufa antheringensis]
METTLHFVAQWLEARTRFSNQLKTLHAVDLAKKLGDSPNSIGFLIRHIGDVELLFSKNVFGNSSVQVSAKTVISGHDTGEWTDLESLLAYVEESFSILHDTLVSQPDSVWSEVITTKEFGTKTKAEALGRIVSHTAYHAGQIAIIHKYGNS